jgi:hypothetical protein
MKNLNDLIKKIILQMLIHERFQRETVTLDPNLDIAGGAKIKKQERKKIAIAISELDNW